MPGGRHGPTQPVNPLLASFRYLESNFCIHALQESLRRHGSPEIFNTDQASQFPSDPLDNRRSQCRHNVFIEGLWWPLEHNYLYLRSLGSGS